MWGMVANAGNRHAREAGLQVKDPRARPIPGVDSSRFEASMGPRVAEVDHGAPSTSLDRVRWTDSHAARVIRLTPLVTTRSGHVQAAIAGATYRSLIPTWGVESVDVRMSRDVRRSIAGATRATI